jgi:hypothetical protein
LVDAAVICGAGPIGLVTLLCARAAGAYLELLEAGVLGDMRK